MVVKDDATRPAPSPEPRSRRVLFVAPPGSATTEATRLLSGFDEPWTLRSVEDAGSGLAALVAGSFDLLVVDLRVDRAEHLLESAARDCPDTLRVALHAPASGSRNAWLSDIAHQTLTTNVEPVRFAQSIECAFALRARIENPAVTAVVSRMGRLPSAPASYRRLQAELSSDDPSLARVGRIISEDPAAAAKVLQLVNSAFMGLRRPVANIEQAVGLLGLATVTSLTLGAQVFTSFARGAGGAVLIDAEWHRALRAAVLAQSIARAERLDRGDRDAAYLGGLLHNCGRLVLAASMPEEFSRIEWHRLTAEQARIVERERFGATHTDLGGYLLAAWNVPLSVVEAVVFHARPSEIETVGIDARTVVHVATAIIDAVDHDLPLRETLDMPYISALGADDRVDEWWEMGAGQMGALERAAG